MTQAIAEMIGPVLAVFLIGTFILLFPLSRRLGRVLEEWIKLRQETSPDRDTLARLESEVRELRQSVEGGDQRMGLLAERQDFMESLVEAKKTAALPPE
jgi:chorismate mutase